MNNDLDLNVLFQLIDKQVFELNNVQKKQFERFFNLLIEWNVKVNLISRNEKNIIDRHFLNCACIAHFVKFKPNDKIVDLGSGGGFPSVILKILFPLSYFVLTDSVKKKTDFLKKVVNELELQKIDVVNDRVEKVASTDHYHKSFDFVSARAVSSLRDLISLSQPFLKENGKMIFLKGRNYEEEIQYASIDQGKIKVHHLNSIAENQDGVLLVLSAN